MKKKVIEQNYKCKFNKIISIVKAIHCFFASFFSNFFSSKHLIESIFTNGHFFFFTSMRFHLTEEEEEEEGN